MTRGMRNKGTRQSCGAGGERCGCDLALGTRAWLEALADPGDIEGWLALSGAAYGASAAPAGEGCHGISWPVGEEKR